MKVLVTGGAGYIGTTLLPQLLKRKYQVTVVDSLRFGGRQLIPFFSDKNFNFIKGDVRDKKLIKEICKDKDVIIHLAAVVGYPDCRDNPVLAKTTNIDGSKNIAQAVEKSQLVIFGSTSSNYGSVNDQVCTEKTTLRPQSLYGRTKVKAERYLLENSTCTAFRFATAFGLSPRLRIDLLVHDFVFRALNDKSLIVYEADFKRSFIHVSDMASAFLHAIDNEASMKNKIYNVGSDKLNFTKRQVAEFIKSKTDAYIHYADYDQDLEKRNYLISFDKIAKTGYKTKISLKAGVKELVNAMKVL